MLVVVSRTDKESIVCIRGAQCAMNTGLPFITRPEIVEYKYDIFHLL